MSRFLRLMARSMLSENLRCGDCSSACFKAVNIVSGSNEYSSRSNRLLSPTDDRGVLILAVWYFKVSVALKVSLAPKVYRLNLKSAKIMVLGAKLVVGCGVVITFFQILPEIPWVASFQLSDTYQGTF